MQNFTEIALKYFRAGFHVLPIAEDKTPTNKELYGYSWDRFKHSQTEDEVKNIFSRPCFGIAVITGVNDLEVIDIDCKYDVEDSLLSDFIAAVDTSETQRAFIDFPIASTQNKGFHLFYRAKNISGNEKLASRPTTKKEIEESPHQKSKVLIETRGKYGYVIVEPTPGYTMDNGSLFDVPEISPQERNGIIISAKSLNRFVDYKNTDRNEQRQLQISSEELTPWDDYNNRTDVTDYLTRNGWTVIKTVGERTYLRRPGKDRGFSGNYHEGKRTFICFSTSTQLPSEKGLTAYGVYTYIEHGGDFAASAKALYYLGFGSRKIHSETQFEKNPSTLWDEMQKFRYDPVKKPKAVSFILKAYFDGNEYEVAAPGNICMISGLPKSMKTTFLRAIMSSGLSAGQMSLGMSLDLKGRTMLSIDTEQPEIFWHTGNTQLLDMAGATDKPQNFESFVLREYDPKKRMAAIEVALQNLPNVGVLVLDGLLDLVHDYNDQVEASTVMNTIMRWTSQYNLLCLPVLHLGKGNREMLGALGSIAARKCDVEIRMTHNEDEGNTEVRHKLARTRPFKPFSFYRNEEGLPVLDVKYEQSVGQIAPAIRNAPAPKEPAFDPVDFSEPQESRMIPANPQQDIPF